MLGVNTFYIISDHNTSAEALSLDQAPDWLKIRVKKVKPNPSQLLILFIRRWLPRTKWTRILGIWSSLEKFGEIMKKKSMK